MACQAVRESTYKQSSHGKKVDRDSRIKRRYGLSASDFTAMLKQQDDRCGICSRLLTLPSKRGNSPTDACVDHNHSTNVVRGLLCHDCNTGIGLLKEDKQIMLAAIRWLS